MGTGRNLTRLVGWHPAADLVTWLDAETERRGGGRGTQSAILEEALAVSACFTEAEAAAINEARGIEDRATWLRRAALVALERQRPPAGSVDRQAEAVRENLAAMQGAACPPHPHRRVNKGLCSACGRSVGDEEVSLWARIQAAT